MSPCGTDPVTTRQHAESTHPDLYFRECMGIEPPTNFPKKTTNPAPSGAKSGALAPEKPAIDPALAAIIDVWPTLSEPMRAGILAMVNAAGGLAYHHPRIDGLIDFPPLGPAVGLGD
ncbi:MAG: hypothetical protein N2039_03340 [Gemmataceae bacterium]|nr:hypothetical protein [Gemmataceae bacterium]